jgi:hypothetical protein
MINVKWRKDFMIYKYRSDIDPYVDRIFTHSKIHYTSPLKFNDPFDCRIPFYDEKGEQISEKKDRSILSRYSIFCLTKRNDDILMYSHYANGHKGFCLEFDDQHKDFNDYFNIHEVRYSPDMPFLNFSKMKDEDYTKKLLTKSIHWEYEEEYRSINIKKGSHEDIFPEEVLSGVIFGCQMTNLKVK